ncbi:hypothetical protein [Flavobacterium rivulicola]|nr:hypothetical protein [Flavobacterium sp. IMCC34852]
MAEIMKNVVVKAILILVSYSGYCQEKIFYEKIAFEFYKDSIMNQSKEKIKLQKKLERGAFDPNWFPRCEKEIKIKEIDTVFDNRSNQFELPNLTDNKFKIKNRFRNTEYVCLDKAVLLNKTTVLVNINEVYKHRGIYYHILLDLKGKILRYCKGGYTE